jgi:hypothetical protein
MTVKSVCPGFDQLLAAATSADTGVELETHLQSCGRCRRRTERMRRTVEALRAGGPEGGGPETAAPERPALLGRYFVVGDLPAAGPGHSSGRAFRGLHPTLIFDVELHLAAVPADKATRERLAREAPLLAGLIQPDLVRALDAELHEGRVFVVTERVPRQMPLRRPKTPAEAALLVARLARQLAVAHGRGLVHGGIGPDCLVSGPDGEPRLAGMGLALVRGGAAKTPADDVTGLAEVLRSLIDGELPRRLAVVLRKAAAGEYATADAFAEALECFVGRPRRLRRLVTALAAGLALAALAWTVLGC